VRERERRRGRDQVREADREQGRPLDQVADAAEIRHRAELSREKERADAARGHAFTEHVDASDEQLRQRAEKGINARGHAEGFVPENATRWQSDAACVITADRLWRTPQAQQVRGDIEARLRAGQPARQSFTVRAPLSQVLGPGWRDDVYGRSRASHGRQLTQWGDDGQAIAVYRRHSDGRWYLHTCYPDPNPLPGP
jgi:hypothetical protein